MCFVNIYLILTYDPFGANRMIYTVKNVVTEDNNLLYNDGVTNLFLYTGGKIGGSKALADLLNHMTHTTEVNAVDSDLKQIQSIVDAIKSDRKVGERYMSMEKMIESAKYHSYNLGRENGLSEGLEAGIEVGIHALMSSLNGLGVSKADIKSQLLSNFEISEADADLYINNFLSNR